MRRTEMRPLGVENFYAGLRNSFFCADISADYGTVHVLSCPFSRKRKGPSPAHTRNRILGDPSIVAPSAYALYFDPAAQISVKNVW